ncbi:MerR family transcriptional regulator [Aquihabitans sp. McL0605]|uniref:MerR family transcriptional regulator n=1 Tax=Aquihabitans sp. McL0605 TaxID=3415671 RepID=UPI003CFB8BF3
MTDHLSIGEVLSLLQDEFPDVTISKIRFLESQGLIDPERTPSGYRKFYESDIDRLRWILVQQREHFLPLKVIKDRLADPDAGQGELLLSNGTPPPEAPRPAASSSEPSPSSPEEPAEPAEPAPAAPAVAHESPAHIAQVVATAEAELAAAAESADSQPIWMVDLAKASAATKASAAKAEAQLPLAVDSGPTEVSLTAQELATAAGISRDSLRALEQYGLITGRALGDSVFYDGDALIIASKASGFLDRGVEARHLRMYKVAAEREAGFMEQLTMPLLKQRNPQARREAVELVEELSALGHDLRAALLRSNLRRHLDQA